MTLESRMRIDGYNELISRALKIVEQQVMQPLQRTTSYLSITVM